MREPKKKTRVAIDFDGVICDFKDGYKKPGIFGDLIPGVREGMERLRDLGYFIIVYSCRGENELISQFLDEYSIPYDSVNEHMLDNNPLFVQNPTKVVADIYVDDRAVRFHGSWQDLVNDVESFRPWYYDGTKPSRIGYGSKTDNGATSIASYLRHSVIPFVNFIDKRFPDLSKESISWIVEAIQEVADTLENN